MNQE
ncbi:hypothetical protein D030_3826A, partial [Vibrio parahaemolyticus AQ3810]